MVKAFCIDSYSKPRTSHPFDFFSFIHYLLLLLYMRVTLLVDPQILTKLFYCTSVHAQTYKYGQRRKQLKLAQSH